MTLKETVIPVKEDLTPLLQLALQGRSTSVEDWISNYLSNTASLLAGNPKAYRSYGPWWWIVKAMLTDRGFNEFGSEVDPIVLSKYSYDEDQYNLLAAWTYMNDRFEAGLIYGASHVLYTMDEETYTYELIDDEMETLIAQQA